MRRGEIGGNLFCSCYINAKGTESASLYVYLIHYTMDKIINKLCYYNGGQINKDDCNLLKGLLPISHQLEAFF